MRKLRLIIVTILFGLFLSSCSAIQEALNTSSTFEDSYIVFKDNVQGRLVYDAYKTSKLTDEDVKNHLNMSFEFAAYVDTVYGQGGGRIPDNANDIRSYLRTYDTEGYYHYTEYGIQKYARCYFIIVRVNPYNFNITYHGLEGSTYDGPATYNIGSNETLPSPTKQHHDFLGFYTNSQCTVPFSKLNVERPSNIELWAKFSDKYYAITYAGLYNVTNPNTKTKLFVTDGTFHLADIPSTEYYDFIGWKIGNNYIASLKPSDFNDDIIVTADIEFYSYTITYKVDGNVLQSFTTDYREYEDGKYDIPCPTKEHYSSHWDKQITKLDNYEINAVYEAEHYFVNVVTNLNGYSVEPIEITYGALYSDIYNQLDYPNHLLTGLYSDKACTEEIALDSLVESNVTVNCKWEEVYEISTPTDFSLIVEHPNAGFKLTNDINFLSDPIPVINEFRGIFDGNGHVIKNFMNQNMTCSNPYALFYRNYGTIKNVTFKDGVYTVKNNRAPTYVPVGFVVGDNAGTIDNVHIEDCEIKITTVYFGNNSRQEQGSAYAGAISANNSGTIKNCSINSGSNIFFTSSVETYSDIFNDRVIRTYFNFGAISGANHGTLTGCSNAASITVDASRYDYKTSYGGYYDQNYQPIRVGGIVGLNEGNGAASGCKNSGDISFGYNLSVSGKYFEGTSDLGGICGYNAASMQKCYTTYECQLYVNTNGEQHVGGVVGYNSNQGNLKASYSFTYFYLNTRDASKATRAGGVCGMNDGAISYTYAVITSVLTNMTTPFSFANFGGLVGRSTQISALTNSVCVASTKINPDIMVSYELGLFEINATFVRLFGNYCSGYYDDDNNVANIELDQIIQKMKDLYFEDLGYIFDGDNYPTFGF